MLANQYFVLNSAGHGKKLRESHVLVQIIWTAVLSFVNEILLGPQGILNLLQRKVDL